VEKPGEKKKKKYGLQQKTTGYSSSWGVRGNLEKRGPVTLHISGDKGKRGGASGGRVPLFGGKKKHPEMGFRLAYVQKVSKKELKGEAHERNFKEMYPRFSMEAR